MASTKAFTTQLAGLFLLTLAPGPEQGRSGEITRGRAPQSHASLRPWPCRAVLALEPQRHQLGRRLRAAWKTPCSWAGAVHYPIALGRRAQAQGNQLHPRRGPAGRRTQARPLRWSPAACPVVTVAPNDALLESSRATCRRRAPALRRAVRAGRRRAPTSKAAEGIRNVIRYARTPTAHCARCCIVQKSRCGLLSALPPHGSARGGRMLPWTTPSNLGIRASPWSELEADGATVNPGNQKPITHQIKSNKQSLYAFMRVLQGGHFVDIAKSQTLNFDGVHTTLDMANATPAWPLTGKESERKELKMIFWGFTRSSGGSGQLPTLPRPQRGRFESSQTTAFERLAVTEHSGQTKCSRCNCRPRAAQQ